MNHPWRRAGVLSEHPKRMKAGRGSSSVYAAALVVLTLTLGARQASAQTVTGVETELDTSGERLGPTIWPLKPVFDRSPGWSIGLDAYAGLAVLSTGDGGVAHGFVGGISRFQLSYFQIGASLESSDGEDDKWRSIGGFVGAFIPFKHWVDFEFAAGLSARTYRNDSRRYGADGYEATSPSLTLRAGVSDRAVDDLFGIRLGGHLTAGIDLERHTRPWRYVVETEEVSQVVTGESEVGGISVGLAITAGFDIGRKPAAPRRTASR